MPRRARKRIVRREALERAAPPLLARYLAPFSSFFDAHAVALAPHQGDAGADADRALARRIHALVHDDALTPPPPPELLEALSAFEALATPDGAAELVRLDRERSLPRGTHGDEDLALCALLERPELARAARVAAAREGETKFVEYAPRGATGALVFDDAALLRLRALLATSFEEVDHTGYCEISCTGAGDEIELEIDHGSRPRTRDRVDPASLRVANVTDVTARRAYARLDRRNARLCVRALPRARELIRRAFGQILANDAELFRAEGLYDLSPFLDLGESLSTEGVPRLVKVELHQLGLATEDGLHISFARPRKDALASSGRGLIEVALDAADPVSVRVYLHVLGRARPIRLELFADGKHNAVDFDRDDPEVVAVVQGYMRARGILLAPGADAEAEPAARAEGGGRE